MMKTITQTFYRSYRQTEEKQITKVVHNIPSWIFEEYIGSDLKNACPVCHKEMRLNIAHGAYIEECSVIEVSGRPFPIHTECYNKLPEQD